MGEDFMEKHGRRIRRSIDKNFEKFKETNLFSNVPPECSAEIVGILLPGADVSPGQKLVRLQQKSGSQEVVLCQGGIPAVELSGEAASHAVGSGLLAAEVVSVLPEAGMVEIKFYSRYGK